MEIQSQAPMSPSVSASSNTSNSANGNTIVGTAGTTTGQAAAGFSATLNGMLSGAAEGNQTAPQLSLAGLNALVQLMTDLKGDTAVASEQSMEDSLNQLDALLKLLDSNTDDASALVENPDVQAWLAQIQALLLLQAQTGVSVAATQTEADGESEGNKIVQLSDDKFENNKLNPQLFVPLETVPADSAEAVQTIPVTEMKPVSKAEARKLLESFKELLQTNRDQNSNLLNGNTLQKIVTDLQQVLAPLLSTHTDTDASKNSVSDSEIATQLIPAQSSGRSSATSALPVEGIKDTAQVQLNLTTVNPKLEMLAAKTLLPKLTVEEAVNEAPLFEPLQEAVVDLTSDNHVMPMHEFLKQVQTGEQITKMPVLMMHAPTFAEDMAEFVVKSFTLDARAEGITEAKLSLYPQHLGQVDVKLTIHNGQLIAQFMAESSLGKEMLESQLSQLRTTLQSQGIHVEKLEVTQSQSFQSGMFQEQRQQQSQQSNKQKGNGSHNVISLDEEKAQVEAKSSPVINRLGQASIDTTA